MQHEAVRNIIGGVSVIGAAVVVVRIRAIIVAERVTAFRRAIEELRARITRAEVEAFLEALFYPQKPAVVIRGGQIGRDD